MVYPKVKVREQEQDDQSAEQDIDSSETEYLEDSSHIIAKIPKTYVPNLPTPKISVSKGAISSMPCYSLQRKKEKKADEDDKSNIRASSVPRPRAVLSSPENDGMIGNQNRTKAERLSALNDHNMVPNRHAKCKVIRKVNDKNPLKTLRETKEAANNKDNGKGKKVSHIAFSSKKDP
ncbi:uncharacterized protein LOC131152313 [Malania oleifera]|uniref:uncharacterized protein LOC131152313 n=1 Tax=Malania oleifera TaxID=397392 RepID=UPI0025AE7275|nr:uncharacterized protein LOC131152313 [Malania oleifera]